MAIEKNYQKEFWDTYRLAPEINVEAQECDDYNSTTVVKPTLMVSGISYLEDIPDLPFRMADFKLAMDYKGDSGRYAAIRRFANYLAFLPAFKKNHDGNQSILESYRNWKPSAQKLEYIPLFSDSQIKTIFASVDQSTEQAEAPLISLGEFFLGYVATAPKPVLSFDERSDRFMLRINSNMRFVADGQDCTTEIARAIADSDLNTELQWERYNPYALSVDFVDESFGWAAETAFSIEHSTLRIALPALGICADLNSISIGK